MPRWELADQQGNEYIYVDANTGQEMRVPINALESEVVSPVRFAGAQYNQGPTMNHSSGWTTGGGMAPRQVVRNKTQVTLDPIEEHWQPEYDPRFDPGPAQPPMPQQRQPEFDVERLVQDLENGIDIDEAMRRHGK